MNSKSVVKLLFSKKHVSEELISDNFLPKENPSQPLADLIAIRSPKPTEEAPLTVDVFQNEKEIVIQAGIAGVDNDQIDISITKDLVTLRGVRKKSEKVSSSHYFHEELYWGAFSRSVILPVAIDVDRSKASVKNGLLTIRLPKLS